MRKNTKNRISIVTIAVAILLIVVLSTAIAATFGNGVGNNSNMPNAAGEVPIHFTENNSIDGIVASKKTQDEASAEGAQWITTTQQLLTFLNSAKADQKAYLGGNVTIDYATMSAKSSDIPFYGIIDGNGYTVNINSVGGDINYVKKPYEWVLYSDFGPEPSNRQGNEYHASGLFVGVNYGTIKNLNFNYTSTHQYAWAGEASGPNWSTMLVSGATPKYTTAFGIVCGINYGKVDANNNGIGGIINNCSLKVNDPLVVFHQKNVWNVGGADSTGSNDHAYMFSNSAMVGGYSGVTGRDGSEITRCTLDIGDSGSINGLVLGNDYGSNVSKHSLSIAGGISGNFYPGKTKKSATISYCTIKGNGAIRACSAHGSKAGFNHSYVGAVVGTAGYIKDWGTFARFDMTKTNIHHVMSSWQGMLNYTDGIGGANSVATPWTSYARLFGAIGNSGMEAGTINGIVLLFDMQAFLTNLKIESPEYIDEGKVDHRVKASDSAILVYRTNDGGAMKARFDYTSQNKEKDLRIETLAGTKTQSNDYTFKNFLYNDNGQVHTDGNMDMQLPQSYVPTGSLKFKMGTPGSEELSQTGKFIWDATFIVGSSSSGHIKTEDMCGAEILLANASVPARYAYTFGEITNYDFDSKSNVGKDGNTTSKEYDGLPLNAPKIKLISTVESAEALGETGGCYYNITNKAGAPLNLENTVAPGVYYFEPEQILGEEKVVYYSVNQRVLARKKPVDKKVYTFGVGPAELDIKITERTSNTDAELWLQQATFELSILQNGAAVPGLFDYIKVMRDGTYSAFIPTNAVATYLYKETKNTTTVGATYSFTAYKTVKSGSGTAVTETKVPIASSANNYKVKIDNIAPAITDVVYTDATTNLPLEQADLAKWRKTPIKITYNVKDDKSLIQSGLGQDNAGLLPNAETWSCEFLLQDTTARVITYTDGAGNIVTKTISAKIDATNMMLKIGKVDYPQALYPIQFEVDGVKKYFAYAQSNVTINYTPTYGGSGATLWYSWQKDGGDQPIWIESTQQMPASGQTGQFVIDWDMLNAEVRMKIVNNADLYADVNADDKTINSGSLQDKESGRVHSNNNTGAEMDNALQTFTVFLAIANLYIGYENILYESEPNNWTQLTKETASAIFAKEYDGTQDIDSNRFKIRLYTDKTTKTLLKSNSVQYTVAYSAMLEQDKPLIIESDIQLVGTYNKTDVGSTSLAIKGISVGANKDRYIIRFNNGAVDAENPLGEKTLQVSTNINPRKIALSPNAIDGVAAEYVYGTDIPTQATYKTAYGAEFVMRFTTAAIGDTATKTYTNIGTYSVTIAPASYNSNKNFSFDMSAGAFKINPRPVTVRSFIQHGVETKKPIDAASITYDGREHKISGEYVDVLGATQQAVVTYYSDYAATKQLQINAMTKADIYYVKVTPSANYVAKNQVTPVLTMSVLKGIVDVKLINNVKDYNKQSAKYAPTLPTGLDAAIFNPNDMIYTYFKVANAKYTIEYTASGEKNLVFAAGGEGKVTTMLDQKNVIEPGLYAVKVKYPDKANSSFFGKEYDGFGYLCIAPARTQVTASNQTFVYDGNKRTYDAFNGNAIVTGLDDKTDTVMDKSAIAAELLKFGKGAKVKLQMFNSFMNMWQDVDTSANVTTGHGYESNIGTYKYRLVYTGDQSLTVGGVTSDKFYQGSNSDKTDTLNNIISIELTITPATITGIVLNNVTKNFVPGAGVSFDVELSKNAEFQKWATMAGTKVTYTIGGTPFETPPKLRQVGTYDVFVKVVTPNYSPLDLTFQFVIDPLDLKGLSIAGGGEITYDGDVHKLELVDVNGKLSKDLLGNYRYDGVDCVVNIENATVKDVMYDKAGKVASAIAKYTITVPNYKQLIVTQVVTVNPKLIENIEFDSALARLDDKTDVTKLTAKFTDVKGGEVSVPLKFYLSSNATGMAVTPGVNGRLPIGTYSAAPDMSKAGNYITTKYATSINVKPYAMPQLVGIENGGIATDTAVSMTWLSATASVTLNGAAYTNGANITKAGSYSLVYTDKIKNIVETYTFKIVVSSIVIKDSDGNVLADGAEVAVGKEMIIVWDKDNYLLSIDGVQVDPKQYPSGVIVTDVGAHTIELTAADGTKTSYKITIAGEGAKKSGVNLGVAVGAGVGGLAIVGAIVAIVIFLIKKKK